MQHFLPWWVSYQQVFSNVTCWTFKINFAPATLKNTFSNISSLLCLRLCLAFFLFSRTQWLPFSGRWPQSPWTWIHVAFTEAIKSPLPSSAIRLTQGQVWASKHAAACRTAIRIQTSDGCRLRLAGPADAFICAHIFFWLPPWLPYAHMLNSTFFLTSAQVSAPTAVNPVRRYDLKLHNLVCPDASWFPTRVLGCGFVFYRNGNSDSEGWEAHCCFVLLLQHCACLSCAEHTHIYISTIHIFMCLSGCAS